MTNCELQNLKELDELLSKVSLETFFKYKAILYPGLFARSNYQEGYLCFLDHFLNVTGNGYCYGQDAVDFLIFDLNKVLQKGLDNIELEFKELTQEEIVEIYQGFTQEQMDLVEAQIKENPTRRPFPVKELAKNTYLRLKQEGSLDSSIVFWQSYVQKTDRHLLARQFSRAYGLDISEKDIPIKVPYPGFQKYSYLDQNPEIFELFKKHPTWAAGIKHFYGYCKEFFKDPAQVVYFPYAYCPEQGEFGKAKALQEEKEMEQALQRYTGESRLATISKDYGVAFNGDLKEFLQNKWNLHKKKTLDFIDHMINQVPN